MKRRKFLKNTTIGALALSSAVLSTAQGASVKNQAQSKSPKNPLPLSHSVALEKFKNPAPDKNGLVNLGHTDIKVSRLCVGCMSFGDSTKMHAWSLDQQGTTEIIKECLDNGLNFFDTANVYAAGTSEEFMAHSFKALGVKRQNLVLATKVYFNEGRLSKKAILREVEGSLKRLNTDYIDLYIIHRYDYATPIEESMEALDSLVRSGKVRALGASAMYGYQFMDLQRLAEKENLARFEALQNHYSLLYREDERELLPIAKAQGVAITPYSPLAAGRLSRLEWKTNTHRSQSDTTAAGKYDSTKEADFQIIKAVDKIAKRHNATMTQIALAWQFAKGVTSPIVGFTKTKYIKDAVGAMAVRLSPADIKELESSYLPHKVVGALDFDSATNKNPASGVIKK